MKILFVSQTYMEWYRGGSEHDHAANGGKWVDEHGDNSADTWNFQPFGKAGEHCEVDAGDRTVTIDGVCCFAYIPTGENGRSDDGAQKALHIENIRDCQGLKKDEVADDVLVVFCATPSKKEERMVVVGWYCHAYVFRHHLPLYGPDPRTDYGEGNILARAKDVVLLPEDERRAEHGKKWFAPIAQRDGFGFGRAHYWFAKESQSPEVKGYVEDIVQKIETYDGDNLMDYAPCPICWSAVPREVKYCDQCGAKMRWEADGDAWTVTEETMNPFFDFARFVLQGAPELSDEERKALREANYIGAAVSKGHGESAAEDAAEVATNDLLLVDAEPKAVLLIVSANEKRLDAMEVQTAKAAVERFFQKKPLRALLCGAMLDKTLKDDQARVTLIACE